MTTALSSDSEAYRLDRRATHLTAEFHASKSLLCVEHKLPSLASLPILPEEAVIHQLQQFSVLSYPTASLQPQQGYNFMTEHSLLISPFFLQDLRNRNNRISNAVWEGPFPRLPQSRCLLQTPLSKKPKPWMTLISLEVWSKLVSDVPAQSFQLVPVIHHHHSCVNFKQLSGPSGHPILGQQFH